MNLEPVNIFKYPWIEYRTDPVNAEIDLVKNVLNWLSKWKVIGDLSFIKFFENSSLSKIDVSLNRYLLIFWA